MANQPQVLPTLSPTGMLSYLKPLASLLKVLSNPKKLMVWLILTKRPLAVCQLVEATGLSQPLVSRYLKELRYEGIVVARREGQFVFYEAVQLAPFSSANSQLLSNIQLSNAALAILENLRALAVNIKLDDERLQKVLDVCSLASSDGD